ncbi:MAG: pullulanase [Paenibacillus sp.]|jgi:hypothetical protein|nr:pullulanase [Paenibacillus sp.]
MFAITSYTIEAIPDKFGILSGNRYEFMLELEVDEDDELYAEEGLDLRVIYKEEDGKTSIVKYEFLERASKKYVDFELESDEAELVEAFCQAHYLEADE